MIIIFWEMTPTSLCLYKSLQLRSVTCSHSCTLKMEAIRSSKTSVLIGATRCHLPENDNHQVVNSSPISYLFIPFGSSTPFSYILSLISPLSLRDKTPHPGKIKFVFTLIFPILDSRRRDKSFGTE
jgi:hypothetical protein